MPLGLYLHIPYCRAKCRYCDFYSRGGSREVPEGYVDALIAALRREPDGGELPTSLPAGAEAELPAGRPGLAGETGPAGESAPAPVPAAPAPASAPLPSRLAPGQRPDTVYFGGGTPGLLRPQQVARILAAADPLPGAEITIEANPDGLTPTLLAGWRAAGVNRLSLGVQTADDASLARLGRRHTAADSRAALAMARAAGFENLCGDIMLALPGYTADEFDRTLALFVEGGACHISAYLLQLEPGTAFAARPPAGLPDADAAAEQYLYAVRQLEAAGYAQYEISNFARPGREGRHNLIYWDCGDYLGLGPAAHSCMAGRRFYWPADTAGFVSGTARPVPDGGCTGEDFVMLQLRLRRGLSLAALKTRYEMEFSQQKIQFAERCRAAGYAEFDGATLRLPPRGMLIQNSILCELLS